MVEQAVPGATFLLNSPYGPDEVWEHLPARGAGRRSCEKKLKLYVIDAYKVARETGMGVRINTIMQTCFFAISGVLPRDEAIGHIKKTHREDLLAQGRRGGPEELRRRGPHPRAPLRGEAPRAAQVTGTPRPPAVSEAAPDFVKRVTALMLAGKGDLLPVSAFPVDGTWPTGTSKWEKRSHRARDPGVGAEPLHPVQQVRAHLPARRHPARSSSAPEALASAPQGFVTMDFKSAGGEGRASTRSRSRRTTARAARSASRFARPSRRPRRARRRST